MSKHIVIIGSGLGGLSCGYILAKKGFKVTVLEKQAQFGGCLQTFTRDGVKFETGMHYIGSLDEGQIQHNFFKYFDLFKDVKLSRLDPGGYDILSMNGVQYPIANGEKPFVNSLSRFFPKERDNLTQYYRFLKKITNYSDFYAPRERLNDFFNELKFTQSTSEYVKSATSDPILQMLLLGKLPLYGGEEGKTPLYVHALIHDYYDNGAFRIVGGSDSVATSFVNSIRSMGGDVWPCKKVTKINCDEVKATGVCVEGEKDEIRADYIISDIHPLRLLELVDSHLLRKAYRNRLSAMQNTISGFTVYIRFKDNTVPYRNNNLFHLNSGNVWDLSRNNDPEKFPLGFLYMHTCSEENQQYAKGAILTAYMSFDEVAKWKGTKIGMRGPEYEELKHRKAEALLNSLEQQQPGVCAAIKSYYTSTPLTYYDYTGTERGSMYGVLVDCHNLAGTRILPQTKIPNLFLTGQNTNIHGMLGVMIGSVLTAENIVDITDVKKFLYQAY